jgi:hypothetical protein
MGEVSGTGLRTSDTIIPLLQRDQRGQDLIKSLTSPRPEAQERTASRLVTQISLGEYVFFLDVTSC